MIYHQQERTFLPSIEGHISSLQANQQQNHTFLPPTIANNLLPIQTSLLLISKGCHPPISNIPPDTKISLAPLRQRYHLLQHIAPHRFFRAHPKQLLPKQLSLIAACPSTKFSHIWFQSEVNRPLRWFSFLGPRLTRRSVPLPNVSTPRYPLPLRKVSTLGYPLL